MSLSDAMKALWQFERAVEDAEKGREIASLQADELKRQARDLRVLADFYGQRTDRGKLPSTFGHPGRFSQ